ncbi:alanine racemase [Trinickia dabaoshanensis]|uniref:Alanine racemase n=1 Tax=Trinickia dabaoshanensis TaxID=564714 RepID=A0A2N7W1N8_9BURK|nr:DSD1 family PLP-dependent enzyme [Trinickia dabaoshanensis]PMS23326.1 alanine racemase [Trinickia dabaoshanensis]
MRPSPALGPNAYFIGVAGSRHSLDTPALLLDRAALERNIAKMAAIAEQHGIGLRPHVKTHKSARIAQMQIEAGAVGVSCATLGEAEAMVQAGIPGVLVTSPVVSTNKLRRLVALAEKAGPRQLMVVVDDACNVAELAVLAARLAYPLDVLIDYQCGYHRTGVPDEDAALALARTIAETGSLRLRGIQAYGGNLQHIAARNQREDAAAQLRETVAKLVRALRSAGMPIEMVTGVGTGTHESDAGGGVFTEMQPGSYVFMDVEYAQVLSDETRGAPFETALYVQSTVVSTRAPAWVTVDAGTKSFATDSVAPVVARGVDGPAQYAFFGDEHGKLTVDAEHRPPLAARIEFTTPHCDPTVNLYDRYHVVDGDTLIDIWPIDARGRL